MATSFTHKSLKDVSDAAEPGGFGEFQEARFAGGDFDAQDTGFSHHFVKPGKRQPFAHKHDKAEEVYVVLAGAGRVKLDDEIVELTARDGLRVAPGVTRQFEGGDDGLELIVFGPSVKGDGEIIQNWWKD